MWDTASSGESETSIATWKRDLAAGETVRRGAGVQIAVSGRTAAAAAAATERRRVWRQRWL